MANTIWYHITNNYQDGHLYVEDRSINVSPTDVIRFDLTNVGGGNVLFLTRTWSDFPAVLMCHFSRRGM